MVANADGLETLLEKLPPEIVESFTPEQRAALWQASKPMSWRRHPINLRMSMPIFGRRYFLTVVGGEERRNPDRLVRERHLYPLRTAGNLLFLLGVGGAFYLAAVAGILIFSNLVEF